LNKSILIVLILTAVTLMITGCAQESPLYPVYSGKQSSEIQAPQNAQSAGTSGTTATNYLRDCEVVSANFNVRPNASYQDYSIVCPAGKIPIETTLTYIDVDAPHPAQNCDFYDTDHGILSDRSIYSLVLTEGCSSTYMVYKFVLSATCCKN